MSYENNSPVASSAPSPFDSSADEVFTAPEWSARIREVEDIREALSRHCGDEGVLNRLAELAGDPKWEVRKAVAETLVHVLPDRQFPFMKLRDDSNAFVRSAAASSLLRGSAIAEDCRRHRRVTLAAFGKVDRLRERDIPEMDEMEKAFRREFEIALGDVGHDLRNVLTPLVSRLASAMAILQSPVDEKARVSLLRFIGIALERAKIMQCTVEDIRDFSRATPAQRRTERLGDVLDQAHSIALDAVHALGMDTEGVETRTDVPDGLCCRISRHVMVRVLQNIIKNAYESFDESCAERPRRIAMSACQTDGFVRIAISDTGRGMDEAELAIIRRLRPRGSSKKSSGIGFGLAMASAKVRDHGGTLEIDSEEGKGTTVTITLPEKGERA